MTWNTPDGKRWLAGAEAELFRESLAFTIDKIASNIRFEDCGAIDDFEVELFDSLSSTQQLALVNLIAHHLLTPTDETLDLTAINEATVYVVFQNILVQIDIEIDTENDKDTDEQKFYWRQLSFEAFHACFEDCVEEGFENDDPEASWMTPHSEASRNLEQWKSLVESLADRILWDRDFEMAGSFLDMEPAKATVLKQMMGIEADHYSSIAPDLRSDEVEATLKKVRQITHQKPR